jgi:hypothetical protein
VNRFGVVAIAPKFEFARDFTGPLALVRQDAMLGFIDETGDLKFMLPSNTQDATELSEGRVWFCDSSRHWGLCDDRGAILVDPKYDNVMKVFSGGLAAVNLGAQWRSGASFPTGGEWGYVDRQGALRIPVQYKFANAFSEGLASVSNPHGTSFIDETGALVIDVGAFTAGDFREGVAPVYIPQGDYWLTRFIDRDGNTEFTVDGYAGEFHEGLSVLIVRGGKAESINNKSYGFIDRTGKLAISARYAEAFPFSEGLAAVRTVKTTVYRMGDTWGDTWGYIDGTGKYQIEPVFNEARPFRGGVARVHLGGRLEIDHDAPPEWGGGEWWLIDKNGRRLRRL